MRDPASEPRDGAIRLVWDPVASPEHAGGDEPLHGVVIYELWAKPGRRGPSSLWRRLLEQVTHEERFTPDRSRPPVPTRTLFSFDTYPETSAGSLWTFKVRIGNRAGYYSEFSPEV